MEAMSWLLCPDATSRSTSSSREVKPPGSDAGPGREVNVGDRRRAELAQVRLAAALWPAADSSSPSPLEHATDQKPAARDLVGRAEVVLQCRIDVRSSGSAVIASSSVSASDPAAYPAIACSAAHPIVVAIVVSSSRYDRTRRGSPPVASRISIAAGRVCQRCTGSRGSARSRRTAA